MKPGNFMAAKNPNLKQKDISIKKGANYRFTLWRGGRNWLRIVRNGSGSLADDRRRLGIAILGFTN
jgi:hypothetical protein